MTRKKQLARVKLSVTLPKDQVEWLQTQVGKRLFASMSHGIELCILEGQAKYGRK
jgi:Arc/MetJ-type ribon-helix-helix transcriptional regulator